MKLVICLLILLQYKSLLGQINYKTLDVNNSSVLISNEGTTFQNFDLALPGYEIPSGSDLHTIFSTQFWFAGKTLNGDVSSSKGGFPNSGTDVFKGPISITNSYNELDYLNSWGTSMWEICQSDIDLFKLWWECLNNPPPTGCENVPELSLELINSIYSWPAHGNISQGQSYYLAPYWDYDGDGVYNPDNGDYPIIKGCCAIYMIQNDHAGPHTLSGGNSLGIEMHYMFYQYATGDYLNETTFVDILTINKSSSDYSEFSSGIVMDADIGNYSDDYFGCDSTENLMFFYNADNFDQNAYLTNPPSIGVVSLENNMTACVPNQNATNPAEVWNLLNGLDANGQEWLNLDGNPTNFVFSGNPNISTDWSQYSNGSTPGDCYSILATNHGTLLSGDSIFNSYAILYSRSGNHLENTQSIIDLSSIVKSFYENDSNIECENGTWGLEEETEDLLTLNPNPTNGIITIGQKNNLNSEIVITDLSGKVIYQFFSSNSNTIDVDLSTLTNGIYIVKLLNENSISSSRIVKQ